MAMAPAAFDMFSTVKIFGQPHGCRHALPSRPSKHGEGSIAAPYAESHPDEARGRERRERETEKEEKQEKEQQAVNFSRSARVLQSWLHSIFLKHLYSITLWMSVHLPPMLQPTMSVWWEVLAAVSLVDLLHV
jgi:hypothetical protein